MSSTLTLPKRFIIAIMIVIGLPVSTHVMARMASNRLLQAEPVFLFYNPPEPDLFAWNPESTFEAIYAHFLGLAGVLLGLIFICFLILLARWVRYGSVENLT